ncbi:MAG: DUF7010 family protein [Anaerolineae bacterium]
MHIRDAQTEVRTVFVGGAVGQAVSGLIWLVSAALGSFASQRSAIIALALGGVFIFPLTQLALRLLGRRASLGRNNPFNALAMQVAFTVPFCLPVIGAAAAYNVDWFYPAFMIVVGAHYLPFVTLYGMWQYAVLAAVLIGGGVAIGMVLPDSFTPGGWYTAVVLLVFALLAWRHVRLPSPATREKGRG